MSNGKNVQGFFLLEACVSILLLGIFGTLLAAWQVALIRVEQDCIWRIKTLMYARSLLEKYKATGHMPACQKKGRYVVSWHAAGDTVSVTVRSPHRTCTLSAKKELT